MKSKISKQFCLNGHDTFICGRDKSGGCKECRRIRVNKWNFSNKNKMNLIAGQWRKNHPNAAKKWYKANTNMYKNFQWKRNGIINNDGISFTSIDFDRMFRLQKGICKICGEHQSKLKITLHVDHDHKTGKVRGLLCGNCNSGIGLLHDDNQLLYRAYEYISKNGAID